MSDVTNLDAARARIAELERLVFVPGLWRCPKCKFSLLQANLNAQDGSVTARNEPGDKCPNCNSSLWRVSERDAGNEMADRAEEQMNRARAAEKLLAEKEAEIADLIMNFYRREIGSLMHQAEHWAKENFPLAVHHRVLKADAYYQIVALCERRAAFGESPFEAMRRELARDPIKPPGKYPPDLDIHAYRDPAFVVEKLKSASRQAGGPA